MQGAYTLGWQLCGLRMFEGGKVYQQFSSTDQRPLVLGYWAIHTRVSFIVFNIMLIAIAYGPHQVRLVNVMDIKTILHIVTARKRSLGQGNIFTPVCDSDHMRGCLSRGMSAIPLEMATKAGGTHPTGMLACF